MADKKKQLLDESSVRHFMKIAGTGQLSDDFVKKTKLLKEEASGRGRIFDPHGDDPRHENLNEEDVTEEGKDLEESDVQEESEVQEEGEDLEEEIQEEGDVQEEAVGSIVSKGPGKAIESGKGLNGTGKKPTKKMQYEAKGALTPKGPGKAIESGKGLNGTGKKPTKKVQYESEVAEEGEQLQEFAGVEPTDDLGGGEDELGGAPPDMGAEEAPGATGDLQGLVQAIADAISQHTGVAVSVEGGEGPVGDEPMGDELPPPEMGGGEEAPVEEEPPMQETGIVGYKTEDPKARRMPSGQMQESKKQSKKPVAKGKTVASAKKTTASTKTQDLVEALTKKVLAKLSEASKKQPVAKKK